MAEDKETQNSGNCNHDCEKCASECADREITRITANSHSDIKKIIAVVSGKGGVGKSLVSGLLAVNAARSGKNVAVLDADITGPSVPKMFGISGRVMGGPEGIMPAETKGGIEVMSINLILDDPEDPVIWRGPIISSVLQQFYSDVDWGDIDVMFVDMPPGTSDAPLTVYQQLPVDGIIIVTSPQELVSLIVKKAVNMAEQMGIPILGIVENMSYFECPDCHKKHHIFGESRVKQIAEQYGIANVAEIPIDSSLAELCDNGRIEEYSGNWLEALSEVISR